jgi:pilus assembly protein CpaE
VKQDRTLQFLIVSGDPSLPEEFDVAAQGVKTFRASATVVDSHRAGIEAARLRQPDVVIVEMHGNIAEIRAFAEEVGVVSADSAVVAAYSRQTFADAEIESAAIIDALRARVQDFLRRPLSSGELEQLVARMRRGTEREQSRLGKVISFISNKGGVGKSSVSTNVACELARRHPGRVLLLDVSLQLGVCSSMLDLDPTTSITDAAQQLERLDTTFLQQITIPHDSGLRVLPAPPTVMAAAEVDDRVVSRVIALARRSYDYVVVDTFPVVDGVIMAILDLSNVVCIVTQVIVPVLNGTASLLETVRQLGVDEDRLWVILNRGQPSFAGELKAADVESHLQVAVRHEVPYEKRLPMSVNMGRPQVLHGSRWSGFRKAIQRIVDDIEQSTTAGTVRRHVTEKPAGVPSVTDREEAVS